VTKTIIVQFITCEQFGRRGSFSRYFYQRSIDRHRLLAIYLRGHDECSAYPVRSAINHLPSVRFCRRLLNRTIERKRHRDVRMEMHLFRATTLAVRFGRTRFVCSGIVNAADKFHSGGRSPCARKTRSVVPFLSVACQIRTKSRLVSTDVCRFTDTTTNSYGERLRRTDRPQNECAGNTGTLKYKPLDRSSEPKTLKILWPRDDRKRRYLKRTLFEEKSKGREAESSYPIEIT